MRYTVRVATLHASSLRSPLDRMEERNWEKTKALRVAVNALETSLQAHKYFIRIVKIPTNKKFEAETVVEETIL